MKKYKQVWAAALAALAAALVGCAASGSAEQPSATPSPPPALHDQDIRLISAHQGLFATGYASTGNGCYEIQTNTDFSVNILYTDYQSRQRVYLSADPNSKHNDESDTSWIKNGYGACVPLTDGEFLYVLQFGLQFNPTEQPVPAQDRLPKIYKMELNGANRQVLFTLPQGTAFDLGSGLLAGKDGLYFLILETDGETTQEWLVRADKSTGELQKLQELPLPGVYSLAGGYDDHLLFYAILHPGAGPDASEEELVNKQRPTILRYSLTDRQLETIMDWPPLEKRGTVVGEEVLYWDSATLSVHAFHVPTGQTRTVRQGLPLDGFEFNNFFGDCYDGHVFFRMTDTKTREVHRYGLNLETGAVQELPLNEKGETVGVFGASEDGQLLVSLGDKVVPIPDYAPNGVPIIIESLVADLVLVKAEDYWAGQPVYLHLRADDYDTITAD